MTIRIYPGSLYGTVEAPPSKSMAHRHIICASLAGGVSNIKNISFSDDIRATLGCAEALGAEIRTDGGSVSVTGFDIFNSAPDGGLSVGESGSTLRFMIPLCLLTGKKITLRGSERLFERPLKVYEELCVKRGLLFERGKDCVTVCGRLTPGIYELPGDVSSQFISGLLFALPLLCGDSIIKLTGKLESAPYLMMTLKVLAEYGVKARFDGKQTIRVPGNQKYISHDAYVEGDYSNAAFFEALNLLGNDVRIIGLDENSLQGDKIYRKYFSMLGKSQEPIPLGDCPDLAPVLLAMAAEKGGAEFSGTRRLRDKESDRGAAMAAELAKFGAEVKICDDSITVYGTPLHSPIAALESHNDHRIVMALAVLCTKYGGEIKRSEAVNKSMPDFFEKLESLGAKVVTNEDK